MNGIFRAKTCKADRRGRKHGHLAGREVAAVPAEVIREFILLKFPTATCRGDQLPIACDMSDLRCDALIENRACPPMSGFTQEPIWDVVLESCHADAGRWMLLPRLTAETRAAERWARFFAWENVAIDGPRRGIKILSFPRRLPGVTAVEFTRHYRDVHGPLVAAAEAFQRHINRYVQHHVIAESVQASADAFEPYDAVAEFWVDSIDDAWAAWNSREYREIIRPDRNSFMGPSDRIAVDETTIHRR